MKKLNICNQFSQVTEEELEKIREETGRQLSAQSRSAAVSLVKKHNKENPNDKWILDGTYTRNGLVWISDLQCMVKCKVKITRILMVGSNHTFSVSGGAICRCSHYGAKTLLRIFSLLAKRKDESYESVCAWNDISVKTARKYGARLSLFLTSLGYKDFPKDAPSADEFADWFIDTLWYKKGNRFCSPFEATL